MYATVSLRDGSTRCKRVSCGTAPESYNASVCAIRGGCPQASRSTNFSWNQARWPISQISGFTVGSSGPTICSSSRSSTSCSARSVASSTQPASSSGDGSMAIRGPLPARSADGDRGESRFGGDKLTDHRVARQLSRHQQPSRGLCVGQQQQLLLVDTIVEVGTHPVQVALGAPGHIALCQRL